MNSAISIRKPLQIKLTMREVSRIWEGINTNGNEALKLIHRAAGPMVKAAAGLHLLKAATPEGEWLWTLESHTKLKPRTVQFFMADAVNVLLHVKEAPSEKAWRALAGINDPRDAAYAADLALKVSEFIDGKNAHQLGLSLGTVPPKQLPQRTPRRTAAEMSDAEHRRIATENAGIFNALALGWINTQHFGHLPDAVLQAVHETILELEPLVTALVTARKLKRLPAGWRTAAKDAPHE